MRFIKINNKDYGLKFTSKKISELNAKGITLTTLSKEMEQMKLDNLYIAFYVGLQTLQHDMTLEKAYDIIDEYYEESEDNTAETFFLMVLEEYAKAMGLGKQFKKIQTEIETEKKVVEVQEMKEIVE